MKEIFFDLETTGFSRDWDSIIEIAAVLIDSNTKEILDEFHEYIKPYKKIPEKIVELTGIDNDFVQNCRCEKAVLEDFFVWLIGSEVDQMIGQNCKVFDIPFLQIRGAKYGLQMPEIPFIDTLVISRSLKKQGKLNLPSLSQPSLAEHFGIIYQAHSALEDVKALIKIYDKLNSMNKTPNRKELGF